MILRRNNTIRDVLPIQNLIENLLFTIPGDTPNRRGILQATMGLLFANLLNHTETPTYSSGEQETVFSVLRYVEEHYQGGSLGELAAREHYELTALSRLIRARTGKTYTELVQEKRLSQAAWPLKQTITDEQMHLLEQRFGVKAREGYLD